MKNIMYIFFKENAAFLKGKSTLHNLRQRASYITIRILALLWTSFIFPITNWN